jgi:hypothetical protein
MNLPTAGFARLSDIAAHDRMDAGFHIALNHLREQMEVLRSEFSPQEAIDLITVMPLQYKAPLKILMRGSMPRSLTNDESISLAREYPYLALALLKENAGEAIKLLEASIAKAQDTIEQLLRLTSDVNGSAADDAAPEGEEA